MALKNWFALAALLLFLAVAAGAFGAHGLRDKLDAYSMDVYEKAVFYQFVHALALLIVAGLGLANIFSAAQVQPIGALFLFGIIFFSGSLYGLALSGVKILGAITPIGGVCFLVAWLMLAWKSWHLPGES